ncbi:MAG TPA: protein kinase [Anaerolineae bacterium]|nr:protein kinase [Anaerolineae bacterium]
MLDDSLIGRRLDEYRLETLLGQGGMARVYRGLDVRLNRWVAVKVIDKPFRADPDYTRRFEREAQAIAQLEHPHIVRLYRYGEANGLLYMALQHIEGIALDQMLAAYQADGEFIEPEEASRITREICSALDYAHSRGVIHRDVKPANIILNEHGHAILVDFGLALLADAGTRGEVFGTPHYMAPEQIRSSSQVVPQSDLYALGVILFEMFTNRVPFEAEEPLDVAILHMTEPPPSPREFRPDLNQALAAVILKALAKEPEERYPSGMALVNALERALKTQSPPPTLSHLSVPDRVALRLAERQLPPSAAISDLPPELIETQPAWKLPQPQAYPRQGDGQVAAQPEREPMVGQAAPPARSHWPIYLGFGVALLVLISLTAAAWWLLSTSPRSQIEAQVENQPPLPSPPPSPSPIAPQLVADTSRDFSTAPGGAWAYLWSEADEYDFESLDFEERKYGACWYAEDYVRICRDSGHPGDDADIAWRWTSNVSGHIQVLVTARKIDAGGDGVTIIAYHNSTPVEGLRLDPGDTQGVTNKLLFEADINAGDQLGFVMKKNGQVEYDHTAFQVQIYQQ